MDLSLKELETLRFISNYIQEYGISPTEAEIAAGIGIKSRGVAHRYVSKLEKLGKIKRSNKGRRRNLTLCKQILLNKTYAVSDNILDQIGDCLDDVSKSIVSAHDDETEHHGKLNITITWETEE